MEAPSELMKIPSLSLLQFSSIQKGSSLAMVPRHNSAPAVKGKKTWFAFVCHLLSILPFYPLPNHLLGIWQSVHLVFPPRCTGSGLKLCLDLENPFLLQQWVVPVGRDLLYNRHLVQLSDHLKADYNLNHIIKDIVQMLFKHWQIWGITNPFRKTVPVFAHPPTKEMLHKVKSKPPWCDFEPFPRVLPLDSREIGSSLSTSPTQEAGERNEITPHLFHYKLDKPRVASCW